MENYRKIWEKHHGPIPVDELGRKFDIHHADKNRNNNSIENLKALSIQQHYDIHYEQQDWNACILIRKRLILTQQEIDDVNKKRADSRRGLSHTEATKEKIKSALIGRKRGPLSDEWKAKIASSNKGKKRDNGRTGKKHSDQTRKKMSEAHTGKTLSQDTKIKQAASKKGSIPVNRRKVQKYSNAGVFIEEYGSITEAASKNNIKTKSSIFNNLRGLTKTTGGFIWKYKQDSQPRSL